MSEIRAIESNKHPVYTFQGKDKTLELPMEITDKGKFVSVIVNGSKTSFQLSDEDSEFTVSLQGVLAWHEAGVLTTEEIGGEETIRQLKENAVNDSLTVHLFKINFNQFFIIFFGKTFNGICLSCLSGTLNDKALLILCVYPVFHKICCFSF